MTDPEQNGWVYPVPESADYAESLTVEQEGHQETPTPSERPETAPEDDRSAQLTPDASTPSPEPAPVAPFLPSALRELEEEAPPIPPEPPAPPFWEGYTRRQALAKLKDDPHWGGSDPMRQIFPGQCRARSKQAMKDNPLYIRCLQPVVEGMEVCHYHGGRVPVGMAAAAWKGRGYSKHIPKSLTKAYEAVLDDPELLSLKPEAALIELRIGELCARLETGESGEAWFQAKAALMGFRNAMALNPRPNDPAGLAAKVKAMSDSLTSLDLAINAGVKTEQTWAELQRTVESKARVTARENRRLAELQQTITIEQALGLFAFIQQIVMDYLGDRPDARRAIAERMRPLLLGIRQ